jgi:hypothetical protein
MKTTKPKRKIITTKAKKLGRPFSGQEIKMTRTIRIKDSDLDCIKSSFGSLQIFIDSFLDSVRD